MAPPPSIRQITREVLGAGVPAWGDRLLQPLNEFLRQATELFSGNLNVSQNLAACWLTLTVTEGQLPSPQAVPGLRGKAPYGMRVERVQVLSGSLTDFPEVHWAPTTVTTEKNGAVPAVQFLAIYGLDTGARVTLTLLVKAE